MFQAAKQRRLLKRELDLGGVEDVKDDHFMPPVTKVLDARQKWLYVVKQVAENDNDGPSADALGSVLGGNTRTYLLWPDGGNHAQTAQTQSTANPDDQAYVPGWPVKIGMVTTELLPDVGEGSDGAPVMADVNGDGKLEIGTASIAGPPYLLNGDGTSVYGNGPDGKYITMASEAAECKGTATDFPSIASLGGGVGI